MSSVGNYFLILPSDCNLKIFYNACENKPENLGTLRSVCTAWNGLLMDNHSPLWKLIFDRYVQDLTYDIDHSSAITSKDKVELFNKTRLNNFETILSECIKKTNGKCIKQEDLKKAGARHYLDKQDLTEIIQMLVSKGNLELFAKLLLFKPKFNASAVASNMKINCMRTNMALEYDSFFCLQMMVKFNYNLSEFFNNTCEENPGFIKSCMMSSVTSKLIVGIKITDYMKSGCNFTAASTDTHEPIEIDVICQELRPYYQTGQFHPSRNMAREAGSSPVSFSDKKLQKHICKDPILEEDWKNIILDILTQAEFNDHIYPAIGAINAGTVISMIRQYEAAMIPRPNALSKALAEYDQIQAKKL